MVGADHCWNSSSDVYSKFNGKNKYIHVYRTTWTKWEMLFCSNQDKMW